MLAESAGASHANEEVPDSDKVAQSGDLGRWFVRRRPIDAGAIAATATYVCIAAIGNVAGIERSRAAPVEEADRNQSP